MFLSWEILCTYRCVMHISWWYNTMGTHYTYCFILFLSLKSVWNHSISAYMLSFFSRVWLFATLWTIACQASLSMEFCRQVYWNGFPFPPPGDLPNPGIKPMFLISPALAGSFFTISNSWEAHLLLWSHLILLNNCIVGILLSHKKMLFVIA